MATRAFRISLPYVLTLIVLACTGAVLLADDGTADGYGGFQRRFGVSPAHALFVVAFQQRDCESNLEFLHVLERPELRDRMAVVALFSGTSGEFADAIGRLESRYPRVRFARLGSRERRLMSQLGHAATPYWLLLDRSGAVRLSAPAPPDPLAYRAFAHLLALSLAPMPRT
jgi:hypothetical protein